MQAPSGGNQQPWEFVVVDNVRLKEALYEASRVHHNGYPAGEVS
jgi:nitroreductase